MIPREHGSWAVLIAPILLGIFAADGADPAACALFGLGALGAFLTRPPLQALLKTPSDCRARRWLAAYSSLAAAGFLPLILLYGRHGLLAFAAPAVLMLGQDLRAQRQRRALSLGNEIGGIAVLSLGAPAAFYAAHAALGAPAWRLWALCVLYFCGPIFFVKMAALSHRAAGDPTLEPRLHQAKRAAIAYHGAALALAGAAAAFGVLGVPTVAAFAAAFLKTAMRAARPAERVNFRKLGYQEVGFAAFFTAAALAR